MNTKKIDNDRVTIKQVDYENFEQVTTAGDVIEIIRENILYHHTESIKPYQDEVSVQRHSNKRHGLEMVLDSIIINEAKMQAWQDLKGPRKLKDCGDEYKQLANGAVYYHDNSGPVARFCLGCDMRTEECICVDLDKELARKELSRELAQGLKQGADRCCACKHNDVTDCYHS